MLIPMAILTKSFGWAALCSIEEVTRLFRNKHKNELVKYIRQPLIINPWLTEYRGGGDDIAGPHLHNKKVIYIFYCLKKGSRANIDIYAHN